MAALNSLIHWRFCVDHDDSMSPNYFQQLEIGALLVIYCGRFTTSRNSKKYKIAMYTNS